MQASQIAEKVPSGRDLFCTLFVKGTFPQPVQPVDFDFFPGYDFLLRVCFCGSNENPQAEACATKGRRLDAAFFNAYRFGSTP